MLQVLNKNQTSYPTSPFAFRGIVHYEIMQNNCTKILRILRIATFQNKLKIWENKA